MTDANIVDIFCIADDFSKEFDKVMEGRLLPKDDGKKHRKRKSTMSDSGVMTILIMFHLKSYRKLKAFYTEYICQHCQHYFPQRVSYNRFVEIQQKVVVKMTLFLQLCCMGKCTGFSIIDSTPLRVCRIQRERQHKTFKGMATKGKGTMGWFYGFKLHLIVNDKGEIIDFVITQANVDDRVPLKNRRFYKKLFGKLFADRGYISQDLFNMLFADGIHLVTRIKKNMKNSMMLLSDKIHLRKRAIIETINDELKNICQIEHTRHRCLTNFVNNLISGLIAYNFLPKKPVLNLEIIDTTAIQKIA
jgi:hypothetical protein